MTAAVAALILVSLAFPAGRHQWAVSLVRQPTPFTTLSFQHAAALPTSMTVGGSIHLSFTVANGEGHRLRYPYLVTSTDNGTHPSVLRRGVLTVPPGSQRSASVTVSPSCSSAPCEVQVSLPGHPETIDALLDTVAPIARAGATT